MIFCRTPRLGRTIVTFALTPNQVDDIVGVVVMIGGFLCVACFVYHFSNAVRTELAYQQEHKL
jgi:hypothetical protein